MAAPMIKPMARAMIRWGLASGTISGSLLGMLNSSLHCHSNGNKSRTFLRSSTERGNALFYVLIAVALFAALSLTVSNQNNTQEAQTLGAEQVELLAAQIMGQSSQIENAIQQMTFTGSTISDLDFTLPSATGFNTGSNIHKVFHPSGGGVTLNPLDEKAIEQLSASPPAGWYLGRFNNVEWTKTTGTDVLLVAYQISEDTCASINQKITGSRSIPALSGQLRIFLVDEDIHPASNQDLNASDCPTCEGYSALCVSTPGLTAWAFYNIVAAR